MDKFVHVVVGRFGCPHHCLLEGIALCFGIAELAGNCPLGHKVNVIIRQQPREPGNRLIQFLHIRLNPADLSPVEIELLLGFLYGFSNQGISILKCKIKALPKIGFEQVFPHRCTARAPIRP